MESPISTLCSRHDLAAETDDYAVAFYHSLGFRIYSLGEQYPGIIRYKCIYDHSNWKTYSYTAIIEKFKKEKINCWVSGGIAIDLHLNKRTRIRKDVDISILRKDHLMIKKIFSDWEVFHTHAPGLRYWKNNEYLEKTPNMWLRKNKESPWAFEVMFQESENDIWIYRRNAEVRNSIKKLIDKGIMGI